MKIILKASLYVASCAIAWIPLELVSAALLGRSKPIEAEKVCTGCPWLENDTELGIRARPSASVILSGKSDGKPSFNAQYTIDSSGFRLTPVRRGNPHKTHLVFLGGSYTFGEFVNDDETLPHFVTKHLDEAVPYNFGIPGYGPQQALHIMRGKWSERIGPSTGMAFYIFTDHDVNVANATLNAFNSGVAQFPCYEINATGEMEHPGTFLQARPVQSFIYTKLNQSYFFSLIDWPPTALLDTELATTFGLNYLETTFRIIEETANAYLKRFPIGKFNLIIFPGEARYVDAIRAYFQGKRVTILDYSARFNPNDSSLSIPGTAYPIATVYERVASFLQNDVLRRPTSH